MMTKDELIAAIRQTSLTEQEYMEVFQATIEAMLGGALLGMGMDLTTGSRAVGGGYWVPAPMCTKNHHDLTEGWRPGSPYHEHWVPA